MLRLRHKYSFIWWHPKHTEDDVTDGLMEASGAEPAFADSHERGPWSTFMTIHDMGHQTLYAQEGDGLWDAL